MATPSEIQGELPPPSKRIDSPILAAIEEISSRLPQSASSESGDIEVKNDIEAGETTIITKTTEKSYVSTGKYDDSSLIIRRDPNTGQLIKITESSRTGFEDGRSSQSRERVLYPPTPSSPKFSSIRVLWQVVKAKRPTRPAKALLDRSTGPY